MNIQKTFISFLFCILSLTQFVLNAQDAPPKESLKSSDPFQIGFYRGYKKGARDMTKELKIGQHADVDQTGFKGIREMQVCVDQNLEMKNLGLRQENVKCQIETLLKRAGVNVASDTINPVIGGTIYVTLEGGIINQDLGYQIFVSTHFIQTAHLLRQNENGKFKFYVAPATTWVSREFRKFSPKPVAEAHKAVEDQIIDMLNVWKQVNSSN